MGHWPKRGRVVEKLNYHELRYLVEYDSGMKGQPIAELCFASESEALQGEKRRLVKQLQDVEERLEKLERCPDVREYTRKAQ
jgi:hypothetical protein